MLHRGFEFARFTVYARGEAVEHLTSTFDLLVDVVVRDPEVPGSIGNPAMVFFQSTGDRVGITERRAGGLMHRIDLLADFVDHSAEFCHSPTERFLDRMQTCTCCFDQADQSLARLFEAADETRQPVTQLTARTRYFRQRTSGTCIQRLSQAFTRLIERRPRSEPCLPSISATRR